MRLIIDFSRLDRCHNTTAFTRQYYKAICGFMLMSTPVHFAELMCFHEEGVDIWLLTHICIRSAAKQYLYLLLHQELL